MILCDGKLNALPPWPIREGSGPILTSHSSMSNWPIFVTAAHASPKALNRALLLIQDFEYTKYPGDSTWVLLSSKELPSAPTAATALPLPPGGSTVNDFASMSLADINAFVRARDAALETADLSGLDWLVIDQTGLETSTCLVCERYYDDGEDGGEEGPTDEFRACRVPYEEAWIMIQNLHVGNMGFEEFVDEEAGVQADGSWKARASEPSAEDAGRSETELERDKALQELRYGGYAD
ncbi:hypothetical protein DFH07DRAFT_846252 [Mycena maculata]|uniref:DUF6924 domain-containing protein n=1 Tax=Mycena maculata TaxID=230809 RepID=A0AAD7I2U9_9AGAR|nr:hypothetical protein DFH07DRAFT_846252 [Mycena maculata]